MVTIIFRTALLFLFVTIAIRLMGKRQIGDLQPNELVVTLLLSEIAAIPLQDSSQPILNCVIAIFILVIMEIFISILSLKSTFIRRILNGQAVVIIKNGVIDQQAMKTVRLTVMDLIEQLRIQNVFDVSTVAFAVLEINGDLSVLLKSADQPATAKDVGAKNDKATLSLPVITDGKIISENLTALKITHEDVEKILKQNNLTTKEVFLLTLDRKKNMTLVKMG